MCFKTRPGTSSGPAALWLKVRRRASCIIAKVICPEIIGTEKTGVDWTRPSQGNIAPEGKVGFGERATVFICVILVTTSDRVVMSRPAVSSLRIERSMGSLVEALAPVTEWRIHLSATFGFFINMRRRALPYLMRQRLWACRMRWRVYFRGRLRQA